MTDQQTELERLRARVEELERTTAEMRAMETTRNHLLSNVSHELRTPLVTIIGYVEMIAQGEMGAMPPEVANAMRVVLRNSLRLSSLIDDLLNLSRLQAEELKPFVETVNVSSLVENLVSEHRLILDEKDLDVNTRLAPDLPVVKADRRLTGIAIENLLKNAVKFTPRNGRIEIETALVDGSVRVSVRDNGPGIPEEHRGHVFEPFYQADSSPTRSYGGIGAGLAIVRRVVEAHGGTLDLESEVGQGTTIRFTLPVEGPRSEQAPQASASAPRD